jgi:hypothetical protein
LCFGSIRTQGCGEVRITHHGNQQFTVIDATGFRATVDLMDWGWNGSCNCRTFTDCCLFLLTNQDKPRRQRCPHIESAREFAMETIYPKLIEKTEKIITLTPNELSSSVPLGR